MSDKSDFLWNAHSYTNEYIRFADTKAGVVIAWSTALLSLLAGTKTFNYFLADRWWSNLSGWISLFSFVLLAGAFMIAVYVIAPDLRPGTKKTTPGLVFWESIRSFGSDAEFRQAVDDETDFNRQVANHLFVLAEISRRKFRWLNLSIWFAAIGTGCAVISIFAFDATVVPA